jgi:hypothetical protein
MIRFKEFMQANDMEGEKEDIQKTLSKLPQSHSALVRGFQWKFHAGNTLNGDEEHVGYMDDSSKEIAIAAPWGYGREFCVLHEVAHKILNQLPKEVRNKWVILLQRTQSKQIQDNPQNKDSLDQSPEEIFCMCYATYYSKHKLKTYYNPEWMQFIKNLPQ